MKRNILNSLLVLVTLAICWSCDRGHYTHDSPETPEPENKELNIPVVMIRTEGRAPILSKEEYINATIEITDDDRLFTGESTGQLPTEIRGRGNSTWGMPKKPYKIKLNKKNTLLGMSNDKEWALLANYSDKTLMRNYAAFEISRALNMSWTPKECPVDLYVNEVYQGVYTLTEQVKVSDERVNMAIVKESDNAGEAITGGYFLEIDERHDGDTWFVTARGLSIVFKEPKVPTNDQLNYVKEYFKDMETALYAESFDNPTTGYARYIDIQSFAANYLVQELTKNIDGNLRLSSFLTKSRNGKLAFSNVWDFDITIGNANYFYENGSQYNNGPTGFYVKNFRWYKRLFDDPAFVGEVKKQWKALYPQLPAITTTLRKREEQLNISQQRNFQKWNILNQLVWPNVKATGSFKGEVDYMLDYLQQRAEWLNTELNNL